MFLEIELGLVLASSLTMGTALGAVLGTTPSWDFEGNGVVPLSVES